MEQGDAAWHEMRDSCAITYSRAADALGVGYNSRRAYMKEKLGLTPKPEANWRMMEGTKREPWAAEIYRTVMHKFGYPVVLWTDAFRREPTDHRIGGSVDRIVTCEDEKFVLEIKTAPNADMRSEIPISHLIQMHGLCHTYQLPYAHYFCWSMGQGSLLAKVEFAPELWDEVVYPRYKEFADLWAIRALPPRMPAGYVNDLKEEIRSLCFITAIEPRQPLPQTPPAAMRCESE